MILIIDWSRKNLKCDSFGCPNLFRMVDSNVYVDNEDKLRLRARRHGWTSISSDDWYTKDFCPECSAEMREELEAILNDQGRKAG